MSFIKNNVLIDDFLSDLGIKASAVPVRNIDFCHFFLCKKYYFNSKSRFP